MGISRSINPDIWDQGKGKAKGNTRAVKEFHEYLDEYRSRILQAKKAWKVSWLLFLDYKLFNILNPGNIRTDVPVATKN